MTRLIVLGSSSLVTTDGRRPTQLAFLGPDRNLLVECGVSPRYRLERLGLDRDAIDDVFITHFHPDHAAGLPQFLMELTLLGRTKPLRVYAGEECLHRIQKALELYAWLQLPDHMPVDFRPVASIAKAGVFSSRDFRVTARPVQHVVPTLGIRVDCTDSGKSVVFSSDTEPSPAVAALARGADILFHEATGEGAGHSSASQAAEIARRAGVRRLILIHCNPYEDPGVLASAARSVFNGEVDVAADLMEIAL